MIKILLAEDHNIVRKGIRSLLEKEAGIAVIGEAACGQEILDLLQEGLAPDVVLTDLHMPGISGVELVTSIRSSFPAVNVLVLSMADQENHVIELINAGATGYILKNVTHEEMVYAIRQAAQSQLFICSDIVSKLVSKFPFNPARPAADKLRAELSEREKQVLTLIADGYTNIEIADKLFTSRRTVEGHRQNLLDKTGAKNTATLIRFALRNDLID